MNAGLSRRRLLLVLAVVVLCCCVVVTGERLWTRHRVDWWLDHAYPIFTDLVTDERLHFSTLGEWQAAGQRIPRVVLTLTDQFSSANDSRKVLLLYGLGAASGDDAYRFLVTVGQSSSESDEVRHAAFGYGVGQYVDRPEWRARILSGIRKRDFPLDWCCIYLASLIRLGDLGAQQYATADGLQLLSDAQSDGASADAGRILSRALSERGHSKVQKEKHNR
jgi:hypothetical protein